MRRTGIVALVVLGLASFLHAQDEPRRRSAIDTPLGRATLADDAFQAAANGREGIQADEQAQLARLFRHLQGIDERTQRGAVRQLLDIRREAVGGNPAEFDQLDDLRAHPDEYRGRPLPVWGRIRGVRQQPARGELPAYYIATLEPSPAPGTHIRLLLTELPEGLSASEEKLDTPALAMAWLFELAQPPANAAEDDTLEDDTPAGDGPEKPKPVPWMATDDLILFSTTLAEEIVEELKPRAFMIHSQEYDAYLQSLLQARLVDQDQLRQAARDFLRQRMETVESRKTPETYERFVDVFKNPEAYRGAPVTFRGHVRRLDPGIVEPNAYGIDELYEIWLYTPDSQRNPLIVICTEVPPGLPMGRDIVPALETVTVTGYFFGIRGYGARDTDRIAPFVVARSIAWNPVPPPPERSFPWWGWVVVAVVLAGIAAVVMRSRREERAFHARRAQRLAEESPPRFDSASPLETDPSETHPPHLDLLPDG